MSQYFQIHPRNPQKRLVHRTVEILRDGGVIAYPTDSSYALACTIGNKNALERIRRIRRLEPHHHFTLVCRDLSEISVYAKVDNTAYRLLKALTPGPYTFVLKATHETPRRLQHPKRKTIGIRVPDNPIAQAILEELGEPMLSTTLMLPGEELPLTDPEEIRDRLGNQVDAVIDGGSGGIEATTVIDLLSSPPEVLRVGLGDVSLFENA
ncbi:MAG TPA: threonylcarbamoyl-AMP synthase [Thiotrichales bacterium]|nr:threonylcarbamoyl-AMP synthase [Thiotrichales bacterium]